MARTIEEIYNEIIAEKQSFSTLNALLPTQVPKDAFANLLAELSTQSKVAIWRLWAYIIAVGHWSHEKYWDYAKQELEAIAAQSIAGNLQWYRNEVKKWQFGHLLLWNNLTFRYYYSDTTSTAALNSRLADRVSCVELFNADFRGVMIKVAKETGSGLAPLTQAEMDSLQAYVDRVKFAGVQTDIVSQPADKILLSIKVFYQGTITDAQMLLDVKAAINNYIANIEFDGRFILIKMIDEIQKVSGVEDVLILSAQGRSYLGGYIAISKDYSTESGWLELDNNSNYQLQKV